MATGKSNLTLEITVGYKEAEKFFKYADKKSDAFAKKMDKTFDHLNKRMDALQKRADRFEKRIFDSEKRRAGKSQDMGGSKSVKQKLDESMPKAKRDKRKAKEEDPLRKKIQSGAWEAYGFAAGFGGDMGLALQIRRFARLMGSVNKAIDWYQGKQEKGKKTSGRQPSSRGRTQQRKSKPQSKRSPFVRGIPIIKEVVKKAGKGSEEIYNNLRSMFGRANPNKSPLGAEDTGEGIFDKIKNTLGGLSGIFEKGLGQAASSPFQQVSSDTLAQQQVFGQSQIGYSDLNQMYEEGFKKQYEKQTSVGDSAKIFGDMQRKDPLSGIVSTLGPLLMDALPAFKTGIGLVPKKMPAMLHPGESVLTKDQTRQSLKQSVIPQGNAPQTLQAASTQPQSQSVSNDVDVNIASINMYSPDDLNYEIGQLGNRLAEQLGKAS